MVQFDLERRVQTPRARVFDYYTRVEDLPSLHPDFFRGVKVLRRSDNEIVAEIRAHMLSRELRSTNRLLFYPPERIVSETIEGEGAGSRVEWRFTEFDGGTIIKVHTELRLGLLARALKGTLEGISAKLLEDDVRKLESPGS